MKHWLLIALGLVSANTDIVAVPRKHSKRWDSPRTYRKKIQRSRYGSGQKQQKNPVAVAPQPDRDFELKRLTHS